jgi:2-amino-4-hydroxy-6-hydroxymethyldihydropteridine diphosphokinase
MIYFIGLGSNIGLPRRNLVRARRLLEKAGVVTLRASSIYHTEPVGFPDQPWFLNQVLKVRTGLKPQDLLDLAKSIEKKMRRVPAANMGPRSIDIDLLLAENTVLDSPELTLPHPHLAVRNFVLVPLREIAPRAVHPVLKKTVGELARESPDASAVFKDEARPSRK